jgi:hypothetical protein
LRLSLMGYFRAPPIVNLDFFKRQFQSTLNANCENPRFRVPTNFGREISGIL